MLLTAMMRMRMTSLVKLWQLGYKQTAPGVVLDMQPPDDATAAAMTTARDPPSSHASPATEPILELRRTLNLATNACCAVGIMSIWASSEAYATQGLAYGGPVVVIWGWVLVSCFSMAIALCMAELVSAFPTSAHSVKPHTQSALAWWLPLPGGLYYWSYMLAPVRYRRLACWMTGWINMLGQVATTAALELMITNFVASLVQLHTLGPGGELTHITVRWLLGAQGLRGLGAEASGTELCALSGP
ncbi:hypothetical protein QJQ45_028895, partial [Haematococcus lacustris]